MSHCRISCHNNGKRILWIDARLLMKHLHQFQEGIHCRPANFLQMLRLIPAVENSGQDILAKSNLMIINACLRHTFSCFQIQHPHDNRCASQIHGKTDGRCLCASLLHVYNLPAKAVPGKRNSDLPVRVLTERMKPAQRAD